MICLSCFNLATSSVGKWDSGKLFTALIESVTTPRALKASSASLAYLSKVVLSIVELFEWQEEFRKSRSWSMARANDSALFPTGLNTETWKLPWGMNPRGLTYNSPRVLRLPLLSGKANVCACIVAWNRAVQSHFSYDSFVGTLVLPLSFARNKFLTPMESSQVAPGPNLRSHMCLNVWRRALGNSSTTMVENLKKFNCSSVNDLTTISDADSVSLPSRGEGCQLLSSSVDLPAKIKRKSVFTYLPHSLIKYLKLNNVSNIKKSYLAILAISAIPGFRNQIPFSIHGAIERLTLA